MVKKARYGTRVGPLAKRDALEGDADSLSLISGSTEVIYSLRMPGDMRAALAKAAEKDDRTSASLVKAILREWLTSRGYLKREP